MNVKSFRKTSKFLVLVTAIALLSQSTGCSLSSFGLLSPLLKQGYNTFAAIFNSTLFGTPTSVGL